MPQFNVVRDELFKALGHTYSKFIALDGLTIMFLQLMRSLRTSASSTDSRWKPETERR